MPPHTPASPGARASQMTAGRTAISWRSTPAPAGKVAIRVLVEWYRRQCTCTGQLVATSIRQLHDTQPADICLHIQSVNIAQKPPKANARYPSPSHQAGRLQAGAQVAAHWGQWNDRHWQFSTTHSTITSASQASGMPDTPNQTPPKPPPHH
jgi:hypothetical protein